MTVERKPNKLQLKGELNMNFSSLVLMEKDKETRFLTNELGSYSVGDGAEYISKLYCENNKISIFFDTKLDVEEWEYTAIYDFFNEEIFTSRGYLIESVDEEYNPTWKLEFNFDTEYSIVHKKLNEVCQLLEAEMKRVFILIKEKEEEYK